MGQEPVYQEGPMLRKSADMPWQVQAAGLNGSDTSDNPHGYLAESR
jgi:hypothetical protein